MNQPTVASPPAMKPEESPRWSDLLLAWADRNRRWVLAVLVLSYVLAFSGQWRIEVDSGLYLSVARNLAAGRGYTYHDRPCAVAYPGLPYALAAVFKLLPRYHRKPLDLVPENALMMLVGLAALGLTYRLVRLNAGRPAAVLVTCGVGLTRTFYRSAFAIMTDMPFLLGVTAFLAGYEGVMTRKSGERGRARALVVDALLMGFGLVVTVLTRPAWLAFLPVAAAGMAIAALRGRIPVKAAAAAVVAAALIGAAFFAADPRRAAGQFRIDRYEDQFFYQLSHERRGQIVQAVRDNVADILLETTTSAMFGVKFGSAPDVAGPRRWYDHVGAVVNVATALAVLGCGVGLFARRGLWGMWVVATVAMMIVVLPHERYFLQAMPLLVFGWWTGLRWLNHKLPAAVGNVLFALLLLLGMGPNLGQVGSVLIEQRRTPFFAHYRSGKCLPLIDAAQQIRSADVPADAVVLAPDKTARILTYLSRHTVVEQSDLLLDVGWPAPGVPVYVVDNPKDAGFQEWLRDLGVRKTVPAARGARQKDRYELRWVEGTGNQARD